MRTGQISTSHHMCHVEMFPGSAWWLLWFPSPKAARATHTLLRLLSVVAKRREPQRWQALLTAKVACHTPTVGTMKPQSRPGKPSAA